jgi:anti-sigma regulatory factor (Ser/Thr protein kinase)
MPLLIKPASAELNVIAFDEFVPLLAPASSTSSLSIDLSGLRFIDLFSAIGILLCCQDMVERCGCRVHIELADDGGACSFLPRMGFLDALPSGVSVSNAFAPARLQWESALRGSDPKFLELTPIESANVIDDILDQLIHIVRYNLAYPMREALDMAQAFSEISRNVLDHNPLGTVGFAAMQVCRGSQGRFLQLVVADRGLGILATLTKNPLYAGLTTDKQAIVTSTGLGASRLCNDTDAMRGNGLYQLLEIMKRHGGSVHIRSGGGRVYWDARKTDHFPRDVPYMAGVQIALKFPARTKHCSEA